MTETYVLFGIGVLLSVIGFLIVMVLTGIKSEISEIKGQIYKIEGDLHDRVSEMDRRHNSEIVEIDRRVSRIEARCETVHRGEH